MAQGKETVVTRVIKLAQPIAERLGLKIWDVEFVKEGASWFLRIFIDKKGGVTIDDCEALSRAVDGPLDEADPIDKQYYLEVSSPGVERRLRQGWHFQEELGKPVKVRLIRPDEDGRREFEGELLGYDEKGGLIRVADGDGERAVNLAQTAFVRLIDTEDYCKE